MNIKNLKQLQNNKIRIFELSKNFFCVRFIDSNKERFELEFNLEKGTSFNTFIIHEEEELIIVHPPEKIYAESINYITKYFVKEFNLKQIKIIAGHINPKIIETIKTIAKEFSEISIICSNPCYKLIHELWNQRKPDANDSNEITIPDITCIKKDYDYAIQTISLNLIPAPTARWPGGLLVYEKTSEILLSEKIFSCHIATEEWSENHRASTETDRKYF